MDRFVNHDDFIESLGAYALDAMDPDEAEAVRLHLEECPRCTEEVAQYHQVAALLGNGGGDAPTHLWDEIAGKIGALHPADRSLTAPTPIRPVPGGAARSPSSARVGGLPRRVVLLGAAAAVVVVAVLSIQVARLNDRVGSLNASSASTDLNHLVQAALVNPAAQKVDLASATVASATDAEVVILPSGSAYLVNKGLPALPSNQTYQLWGRTGTQLISLGVLGNRPTNAAFSVGPSAKYRAYLVTAERAGGVVKTTHQPVAESPTLNA
jgi:anti-sigma factor RsiW